MSDFNGNHEILTTDPTTGVARKIQVSDIYNITVDLNERVPVNTDLVPVSDPTTGIAGKSTIKQVCNANTLAVSIESTGTAPPLFSQIITPASGVQIGSVMVFPDGATADAFVYSNGFSTTLTVSNLSIVQSTFSMSTWPSLTSLSFPVLVAVGTSFSPTTMVSLTTLSVPALAFVGGSFGPTTMASLTTLSVPALVYVSSFFNPATMASLTTLSAPALALVGGSFGPTSMASLTNLSVPALAFVGSVFGPNGMASLTTLSAPALAYVLGAFLPNSMAALTSLTIPALAFVGGSFGPTSMASLTTLTAPALTSVGVDINRTVFNVGNIAPATMGALTSLTFPVIEVIGATSSVSINIISGTAALVTFTLGSTLRRVEGNVIMTSCALNQASVDDLLVRLAALDGTGLTTAYSSKTVTILGTSAAPSATGLAAKATLAARGCTVTHN